MSKITRHLTIALWLLLAVAFVTACSISVTTVEPTATATVPVPVVRVDLPPSSTPLPTEAPPTLTPTVTPTATLARIEGLPIVAPAAVVAENVENDAIPWFKFDIAEDFREPALGTVLQQTVSLAGVPEMMWDSWWCAANDAILTNNLNSMVFEYKINDVVLDVETYGHQFSQAQGDGSFCQTTLFYLQDWPSGMFVLRYSFTNETNINDGFRNFPPSTYVTEYTVTVP